MTEIVAVLAAAALFAGFGLLRYLVGPEGIGMCGCADRSACTRSVCSTDEPTLDDEVRHD